MSKKFSFGILFLDEIHHINHFVSIAAELGKEHSVTILTYPDSHEYLKNTVQRVCGNTVKILQLRTHPFRALTDILKKRKHPRKGFWMKYNQKFLLSKFDALIFTDYIHHKLFKYRGSDPKPAFVKIPHGPAGRSYGYKEDLRDFDLHLIFGSQYYDNLKAKDLLGNKTIVVGSAKLDAVTSVEKPTLFSDGKPVVFYNPHFGIPHSSWHEQGVAVLDYFKNQDAYNLIFAPHINLFNKVGLETDTSFVKDYEAVSHIFIDLGSVASVDMVYPQMADIYLGDVSSQSYEFMITPRPCIFINAEKIDYENHMFYPFWTAGKVVENIGQLDHALKQATESLPTYISEQKRLTAVSMQQEVGSTATQRAASEMVRFLEEQMNR